MNTNFGNSFGQKDLDASEMGVDEGKGEICTGGFQGEICTGGFRGRPWSLPLLEDLEMK